MHPPTELGDIVIVRDATGTQSPAIVTSVIDADQVTLMTFTVDGGGSSTIPVMRGPGPLHWQRRPTTMERLIQQSLTTPERP